MVSVVDITQRFRMVSVVGFFMVSVVAGNVFFMVSAVGFLMVSVAAGNVFLWFPSRNVFLWFPRFLMVSVARFLVDSAVTGGSGIFECLE